MPLVPLLPNRSPTELRSLSDAELLSALPWERSAPVGLRAAASAGDAVQFGRAWIETRQQRAASKARSVQLWSALWSRKAYAVEIPAPLGELLHELENTLNRKQPPKQPVIGIRNHRRAAIEGLVRWLGAEGAARTLTPFEVLIALELLRGSSEELLPEQVWPLWRSLFLSLCDSHVAPEAAAHDQRLVLRGEIPWEAGVLLDGLRGASEWRRLGRKFLVTQLQDHTDTDGTPHAELLSRLPLWLAPLIRATEWSRQFGVPLWNESQAKLLAATVQSAVPLCRPDGRLAMSNGLSLEPWPVLRAAAQLLGTQARSPQAVMLNSLQGSNGKAQRPSKRKTDSWPSSQSDWAHLASLRSDWSPSADSLVVGYQERMPRLDLAVLGQPLLHGLWDVSITLDGQPLALPQPWWAVCWNADEDGDYLELQLKIGKARLWRQLWLSRKDHCLLLAECLTGVNAQRIEYTSGLPLVAGPAPEFARTTREAVVKVGRKVIRAFPLALPRDRILSTTGEFRAEDGQLVLKQIGGGSGLYAPLFLDWHPQRSRAEAVWRTLTVTESGQVVRPDVAAGFRLKLGPQHLLIYRGLRKTPHSRAVLGHHTRNETVVARVGTDGNTTPLLLVE